MTIVCPHRVLMFFHFSSTVFLLHNCCECFGLLSLLIAQFKTPFASHQSLSSHHLEPVAKSRLEHRGAPTPVNPLLSHWRARGITAILFGGEFLCYGQRLKRGTVFDHRGADRRLRRSSGSFELKQNNKLSLGATLAPGHNVIQHKNTG